MRAVSRLPANVFDIVVDIGAAHGSYTWILCRKAKKVFAFEPGPKLGEFMEMASKGTNVTLVRAAVGARDDRALLYDAPGGHFGATLSLTNPVAHDSKSVPTEVVQRNLDRYLEEQLAPGRHVDFIKIDVEGYEMEVVEGAWDTIGRHKPVILCEVEKRHNPQASEIFRKLGSLGYRAYVFRGGKFVEFEPSNFDAVQEKPEQRHKKSLGRMIDRDYINNFMFQHPESRVPLTA